MVPPLIGQKAPSAIRCIKTVINCKRQNVTVLGQKAPSAIRCIKTPDDLIDHGGKTPLVRKRLAP